MFMARQMLTDVASSKSMGCKENELKLLPPMKNKLTVSLGSALVSLMTAGSGMAATSVSWLTPANGSSYPVGTVVNPTGAASGVGSTGGGLDLALVLDSSGSMSGAGQTAQKNAALALVAGLPVATSSVAIVRFSSSASTPLGLTPVSTGLTAINNAINGTPSSGGTNIGLGIDAGSAALTGALHTAGRTQMMVVISDGSTSGAIPGERADAAIAAGVDNIHAVGVPGHNVSQMRGIVDGADDIYGNSDDHGIYTSGTLTQLLALFNGTGGNLVGLDHIDVTLPDGNVLSSYPTDGLGNFTLPNWAMLPGANTFKVDAYGTDQTTATATLTLYGVQQSVPDGGTTLMLLGLSLGAISFAKKRFI
jgi:hypothetical protein